MSVTTTTQTGTVMPKPISVIAPQLQRDELLDLEWMQSNRLGSFSASTVCGCNTRRYHGLLIASKNPPLGRLSTLATIMEKITIADKVFQLASNEFEQAFYPQGFQHLAEFKNDVCPTFVYDLGQTRITKQILLDLNSNTVAVRYALSGQPGRIELSPFCSMRDFHYLRTNAGGLSFEKNSDGVKVFDESDQSNCIYITSDQGEFIEAPDWWYKFHYRVELLRGQDAMENLYTPGCFATELYDGQSITVAASTCEPTGFDFEQSLNQRTCENERHCEALGEWGGDFEKQLAVSSDAFVVDRKGATGSMHKTILAGFPWFADWGRDAFIALPGLLLGTKRYNDAREVFQVFTDSISQGMIPNRFDDYTLEPHYNSIDASLWFILAAERYTQETKDMEFWVNVLMPASHQILTNYAKGTRFDIHADDDNLLCGGSLNTQLTWMDAALGDEVITPRHGKTVEVNALWYCSHMIMAERCKSIDKPIAKHYKELAKRIKTSFNKTFVIPDEGYLFDCVNENGQDRSIRPNQIFAVSLPYSPLDRKTQRAVLNVVTEHLLTPMGLRTLSPLDSRYRKRYGGSWQSRDRAYHQGTVWAWLIGPYIEAYLKVKKGNRNLIGSAKELLEGLRQHLYRGCIGQVSEIFDGEPPHTHRGCFAQAWSLGEVLRAWQLIGKYEHNEI